MIPISLPNGKVVFISFEESLDDNFLEALIAKDEGYEIDNPFDHPLNVGKDVPDINTSTDGKEKKETEKEAFDE